MKTRKKSQRFDLGKYLSSAGLHREVIDFRAGQAIFSQGDPAQAVYYILKGTVKLTTISKNGKEAVIALLNANDFFGEGCLAAQSKRMATATAMAASSLMRIDKGEMLRILHEERAFSDRFIAHMLKRNVRFEEDLVDQLFNSTEKRLARALLLLSNYGKERRTEQIIPKISQQTLADIVGTNRSRVNMFMNKFRKLGFIEYDGGLEINSSLLLGVVLHD